MPTYTDEQKKKAAQGIAGGMPDSPAPNTFQGRPITIDPTVQAQAAAAPAPPINAAPMQPAITAGNTAPQVADVRQQVNAGIADARGSITAGLNPMSTQGELTNRLNIALDPRGGNKGSPMARQLQAQAIMQQMGANTQAGIAGIQPIAQAALAGQAGQNQSALLAQQGQQAGALGAQQGQQQMGLEQMRQQGETGRNDASIAGNIDIAKIGKTASAAYQRGTDGTVNLVDGTSAKPVTGPNGDPFTMPGAGEVTAADRFKAFNERSQAIDAMMVTPEAKQQAREALKSDPNFASLFQQPGAAPAATPAQGGAKPANAAAFIQGMRAKGSKMSDAELTAYFNQTYGAPK